jgi:hypothetical protein
MQKSLAVFLLLGLTFVCRADDALPPWNGDSEKAWWTQNPTPDLWPQAAKNLDLQLAAIYKRDGAACFSQADFRGWMEHLEWIDLGTDCADLLGNPKNLETFVALGKDEAVSHLFVEKLNPLDVKKQALQNLIQLAQANAGDLHDYAALGIAYSLVFDQPFPGGWPHGQVRQEAVPLGDLDIVQRFNFYVQANRNKKTDLDLTQVPFEYLKFLVDSKVKLSELEYAQTSKIAYRDFEKAFFAITYDEPRVNPAHMEMTWTYPTYTLNDIETKGGICVDQAYYACILGKGRGIPTIFFTGQGTDGGHAWFAYLSRDLKWVMDCGRYANQNFLKGYAVDPQTWRQAKDTIIEYEVKNGPDNPNYAAAKTALAWARLHSSDPSYRQMLDDARSIMPELAETWETEADLMDKSDAIDAQDKKAFYEAWVTQFQSSADLKVDGQTRLLALLKQTNDTAGADDLQRGIVLQNRSSGADLGIKGSFSAISDKINAQDWDGAKLEFEKAVRDFKDQGGGTFFNEVVRPYAAACAQYGQFKQADDGIRFAEDRMTVNKGSLVDVELTQIKEELAVLEKVQPDMDKWLGEIDGGNYEQAWNDSSKSMQEQEDLSKWTERMDQAHKSMGKCTSRTLASAPVWTKQVSIRGKQIQGHFVFARYKSVFETQPHGWEVVIFQQGDDATLHPMAYDLGSEQQPGE